MDSPPKGSGDFDRRRLVCTAEQWCPKRTAAGHCWTKLSKTLLFWAAFIVTRPLGAVVGGFLDKPRDHGGLELSGYSASAALIILVVVLIAIFPQKSAERSH